MINLEPCPGCGVLLESRLVAAIANPYAGESCPKAPPPKSVEPRIFLPLTPLERLLVALFKDAA